MNSVRAITLLLRHLLAGKTSCLIAELKTIYKMAPFLEAQVKESSCSAEQEKNSLFCVLCGSFTSEILVCILVKALSQIMQWEHTKLDLRAPLGGLWGTWAGGTAGGVSPSLLADISVRMGQ